MAQRPKQNNTRNEAREASIRAVIDAAEVLFSHQGYDGTSLNSIAVRSGVSKHHILYLFGTKEGLWTKTVEDLFERVDAAFLKKRQLGTDFSLEELMQQYVDVSMLYPAYVYIPHIEGMQESWRCKLLGEKYLRAHVLRYRSLIQVLIDKGDLPEISSVNLQNMIYGGVQDFFTRRCLWKHAIGTDTVSAEFLQDYLKTVSQMLRSRSNLDVAR
jgi:TetR/AcrR family transcriptional regulator